MASGPGAKLHFDETLLASALDRCFGAVADVIESKVLEHEHLRLHEWLIAAEKENLKWLLASNDEYEIAGFLKDFLDFAGRLLPFLVEIVFVYSYEKRSRLKPNECENKRYYGFVANHLMAPEIEPPPRLSLSVTALFIPKPECQSSTLILRWLGTLKGATSMQRYILHERQGVLEADYRLETRSSSDSPGFLSELRDLCYQWAIYGYKVQPEHRPLVESAHFQSALQTCFLFHVTIWNSYLKAEHDRAVALSGILGPLQESLAIFENEVRVQGFGSKLESGSSLRRALDQFTQKIEALTIGKSSLGTVLPMHYGIYEHSPFFASDSDSEDWKEIHEGPDTVGDMRRIHKWLASQSRTARRLWRFYELCGGPALVHEIQQLSDDEDLSAEFHIQARSIYSAMKLLTRRLYVPPHDFAGRTIRFDGNNYSLGVDQILLSLLYGLDVGKVPCSVFLRCHRTLGAGGCATGCMPGPDDHCFAWPEKTATGRLQYFVRKSKLIRHGNMELDSFRRFDPRRGWVQPEVGNERYDLFLKALRDAAEVGNELSLREIYIDWYPQTAECPLAKLCISFRYGMRIERNVDRCGLTFASMEWLLRMNSSIDSMTSTASCDLQHDGDGTCVLVTLWSHSKDESDPPSTSAI